MPLSTAEASARGHAAVQARVEADIADYLFIGGWTMPGRLAAERMGVTTRTITRWRARIRRQREQQQQREMAA